MTRVSFLGARLLPVLLLLLVGCDDGPEAKRSPEPNLRPVTDGAPYFCDLVPEAAFRGVTGLNIPVDPRWDGPQTDNGLCLAYATGREAPLGVRWSYNDGPSVLNRVRKKWQDEALHILPPELGEGLAVIQSTSNPRPNYIIALFRCGKRQTWISIDFAPVVRGRDAVRDMVGFMRIAERRFGEVHKCTPKGA